MLAREFRDVALKMLWRDFMECSFMRPLEHRPEGFYPVGMCHAVNVLPNRMPDAFVVPVHPLIGVGVIGIDRRVRLGILFNKILERIGIGFGNYLGPNFIRRPVLNPDYRRFADRSPARIFQCLPFGVRHIPPLPSKVGFINFRRAVERLAVILTPGFPDTMDHEPGGGLRNADVPVKLHRRNRFEGSQDQVDRNSPFAERNFGCLHRGVGFDAEILAAIGTAVRHIFMLGFVGSRGPAFRAVPSVRPYDGFKPSGSRCFVGEHFHNLNEGEAFSVGFSWGFLRHFKSPFQRFEYSRKWPLHKRLFIIPKRKYLPRIASGEIIASFALTEPSSGSDAGSLKTSARRDGDDYILNGTKRFITHAPHAGVFTVMARTDPDTPGAAGVSAFIVDRDSPGLSVGKPDVKMGQRGTHTADVIFEDCRVPAANLIGEEGQGFKTAMKVLDRGRLRIAGMSVGAAERLIEESVNYAKEREQFGRPIADFQLVQAMLADSQAEAYAARCLLMDAAQRRDDGEVITLEAACAKMYCSEMVGRVADRAVQIFGGAGYIAEYPIERFYRGVRLFRIYEGTTQIQQVIIAREMLKD